MKNILVAVELDEHSDRVIRYAGNLAKAFGSKVWLIHIAEAEPDFVGNETGPQYIRDVLADQFREEHRRVQELCSILTDDAIDAEGLMIQGPTVKMILEEANKLKADLIITGTHKHGFFYRAFMGSVSEELFERSDIPLLALPMSD